MSQSRQGIHQLSSRPRVVATSLAIATAAVFAAVQPSLAAVIQWDGSSGNLAATTGSGIAWLTATNWGANTSEVVPTGTDTAQFGTNGSATTIGINLSTPAGNNQAVGSIVQIGGANRTINNSSGSIAGTLTINGVSNGTANILLQNTSTNGLTLANGTSFNMGVVLPSSGNVDVTGTGLVTINSAVSGAGRITKTGVGTLVLGSTASTYTGGLQINGGTVSGASINSFQNTGGSAVANQLGLNGGTYLYTGTVTSATPSTNAGIQVGASGGTINIQNVGTDFSVGAKVSGTGRLTKLGPGTLSLTNTTSTLSGGIQVDGGVLQLGSTSSIINTNGGTVANQIGISNAAVVLYTNTIAAASVGSQVGVTVGTGGGSFGVANGATTLSLGGSISGNGRLTKTGAGTLAFTGATASTYTGGLNIVAGTFAAALVSHTGATPAAYTPDYLRIDGATFNYTDTGSVVTMSANRGVTIGGAGATIGVADASETLVVSAPVLGESTTLGGFVKTGNGALRFNANSTYVGTTAVNAGTLRVNGVHGSPSLTVADYTVASGAALGGTGTIYFTGGSGATINGTLTPGGASNTVGQLTLIGGPLTLTSTAVSAFDVDATAANGDKVVAPSIAYSGTLKIANLNGTLAAGQSYALFTGNNAGGAFANNGQLTGSSTGDGTNLPFVNGGRYSFDYASGTLSILTADTAYLTPGATGTPDATMTADGNGNYIRGYVGADDGIGANSGSYVLAVDPAISSGVVLVDLDLAGSYATDLSGLVATLNATSGGAFVATDISAGGTGFSVELAYAAGASPYTFAYNFAADPNIVLDRLAVVPEPASLSLLGLGAAALLRRRRA